jgi:hypothetical protein
MIDHHIFLPSTILNRVVTITTLFISGRIVCVRGRLAKPGGSLLLAFQRSSFVDIARGKSSATAAALPAST